MTHHFGRMHSRYRWHGPDDHASRVATRLDRIAQTLPSALGRPLDGALVGDPRVVVIRDLTTRFVLRLDADVTDAELARRWASSLAQAVARAVEWADEISDDEIRVFADEAAYLAAFLDACVESPGASSGGSDDWVFPTFRSMKGLGVRRVVLTILSDRGELAPAIVERLARLGRLDRVLDALGPGGPDELWTSLTTRAETTSATADIHRPTFGAAWRIAEALGLLAPHRVTRPDAEPVFAAYVRTDPEPPGWQERRSLARAVWQAFLFIFRTVSSSGEIRRLDPGGSRELDPVLASLDWLDTGWLRERLASLHRSTDPSSGTAFPTIRIPAEQRTGLESLLDDLASLLRSELAPAELRSGSRSSASLRIYAALVTRFPRWSAYPTTAEVIRRLVAAWREGQDTFVVASPAESVASDAARSTETLARKLLAILKGESVTSAVIAEAEAPSASGDTEPRSTPSLGSTTVPTSESATCATPRRLSPWAASQRFPSRAAGVFLLARAVGDLRLFEMAPALAVDRPDPGPMLLAALGRIVAGIRDERGPLDPGLALLAGLDPVEPPGNRAVLQAWQDWPGIACGPATTRWLKRLAGLRLLGDSAPLLLKPTSPSGVVGLVAAACGDRLWPLARTLGSDTDPNHTASLWQTDWAAAFGGDDGATAPGWIISPETDGRASGLPHDESTSAAAELARALVVTDPGTAAGPGGLPLAVLALDVVRAAARWLKRLGGSSPAFLLENVYRRPGVITLTRESIDVELEPRPLDVVLKMSGELEPVESVLWLERTLRFRVAGRP